MVYDDHNSPHHPPTDKISAQVTIFFPELSFCTSQQKREDIQSKNFGCVVTQPQEGEEGSWLQEPHGDRKQGIDLAVLRSTAASLFSYFSCCVFFLSVSLSLPLARCLTGKCCCLVLGLALFYLGTGARALRRAQAEDKQSASLFSALSVSCLPDGHQIRGP